MQFVVHFDRDKCDTYVGRPSKFGNPFQIGPDGNREEVIFLYEIWLQSRPDLIAAACRELPNKILGCWCAPNSCHAEVLARMANGWQLCMPLLLDDEI